jgi:hypothetical protein
MPSTRKLFLVASPQDRQNPSELRRSFLHSWEDRRLTHLGEPTDVDMELAGTVDLLGHEDEGRGIADAAVEMQNRSRTVGGDMGREGRRVSNRKVDAGREVEVAKVGEAG